MVQPEPNFARRVAAETLLNILGQYKGRQITERRLASEWLSAMSAAEGVSVNGWYAPPPNGVAILGDIPRINFSSLRHEEYWPSDHLVNWTDGALYAYSSMLNFPSGVPGDFTVTLYFGQDPTIHKHVRQTYRATQEVLAIATNESSSRRLFQRSRKIFSEHSLHNCVYSHTDTVSLDLGHTFPADRIKLGPSRKLTNDDQNTIRQARRFINDASDWDLKGGEQFTIEPQLVDLNNPAMPQISYHYVVVPDAHVVLSEPDTILQEFGQID